MTSTKAKSDQGDPKLLDETQLQSNSSSLHVWATLSPVISENPTSIKNSFSEPGEVHDHLPGCKPKRRDGGIVNGPKLKIIQVLPEFTDPHKLVFMKRLANEFNAGNLDTIMDYIIECVEESCIIYLSTIKRTLIGPQALYDLLISVSEAFPNGICKMSDTQLNENGSVANHFSFNGAKLFELIFNEYELCSTLSSTTTDSGVPTSLHTNITTDSNVEPITNQSAFISSSSSAAVAYYEHITSSTQHHQSTTITSSSVPSDTVVTQTISSSSSSSSVTPSAIISSSKLLTSSPSSSSSSYPTYDKYHPMYTSIELLNHNPKELRLHGCITATLSKSSKFSCLDITWKYVIK